MSELHLPWLELSVLLPLVGAVWVSLLYNRDRARIETQTAPKIGRAHV